MQNSLVKYLVGIFLMLVGLENQAQENIQQIIAQAYDGQLSVSISSKPIVEYQNASYVKISYIVFNGTDEQLEKVNIDAFEASFIDESHTNSLDLSFAGDPNLNDILDPGEFWIYTHTKTIDFKNDQTAVLKGGVSAESTTGMKYAAGASLLHPVSTNVQVQIVQDYANPGDSIDVELVTRFKIDEVLAKEPGTTFIMVGDTIFEVPLPKSHWEARDVNLKILGLNNDEYTPALEMTNLTPFCDQGFVDTGRNTDGVLDECESIDTRNPACDSTSTEGFCEFPEWVFCMRMEVPIDFEDDYFMVTAYDSMQVWKADEFPPGSEEFNEFEDLTMIINPVEMDVDSILIGSVDTDDQLNFEPNYFEVYPNPFGMSISVDAESVNNSSTLEVYDLNGKIRFQSKLDNENQFDLNHLSDGIYFMIIRDSQTGKAIQIESIVKG